MKKLFSFRLVCVAALLQIITVHSITAFGAEVFVTNLNQTPDGSESIQNNVTAKLIASQFETTFASGTLNIPEVKLKLTYFPTLNLSALNVRILNDSSNKPGTNVIGSYAIAPGSPTFSNSSDISFLASSAAVLQPQTKYWLVFSKTINTDNVDWRFTNNPNIVTGTGVNINPTVSLSTDSASSWNDASTTYSQMFAIVPEPSTYVMSIIGLGCVVLICLRNRRKADQPKITAC